MKAGATPVTPGRVNFCDAAATYCTDVHLLGTVQLTSAGTAVLKLVPGIGSHSYKAVFLGNNEGASSSSGAAALTVTGDYPTTTTIAQQGVAGNYTVTATVAGFVNRPGLASPAGLVSLLVTSNGNAVLGAVPLGTGISGLSWATPQSLAASLGPVSVAAGDFNGDGIPDLAVPNYYGNAVVVLLGNGDGTFEATPVNPATGSDPTSGGDGRLQRRWQGRPQAVTNQISNTVTVLLGNGDGTFDATSVSPATGGGPRSIRGSRRLQRRRQCADPRGDESKRQHGNDSAGQWGRDVPVQPPVSPQTGDSSLCSRRGRL